MSYLLIFFFSYISETSQKYKDLLFEKDSFLYPSSLDNPNNGDQFKSLINKKIKPFSKKQNYNYKSHSFRINFATTILQATHVQNAQQIIGHKDIPSTMTSNRYCLNGFDKNKILEKAFEKANHTNHTHKW